MTTSNTNFNTARSLKRWADICAIIKDEPMAASEIAAIIGFKSERINAFLRHYRLSIHISYWKQKHCAWTPLWALGSGEDAPRPEPRVDPAIARRAQLIERARGFKPQAVSRDWSVEMMFGPAYVGLSAELRGMA